jgi:hypothetical protein
MVTVVLALPRTKNQPRVEMNMLVREDLLRNRQWGGFAYHDATNFDSICSSVHDTQDPFLLENILGNDRSKLEHLEVRLEGWDEDAERASHAGIASSAKVRGIVLPRARER